MSAFGWHPREHRAALDGMLMLTLEERGAYNTALDLIYDRGGPIPDDARWLAGWMGCSLRRWAQLRATLIVKGKLYALSLNGVASLMNQRAASEIENQAKLQRNLSESGAKGGRKRAENEAKAKENNGPAQAPLEAPPKLKTETKTVEEDANASLSSADDDAPRSRSVPEPFELAWKAYPHVKGRSSKTKSLACWRRLPASVRDQLTPAIGRYAKAGREPNSDCGAPAMERWLRDDRYLDWLDGPEASKPPSRWNGPDAVRDAFLDAMGEAWCGSYLDPCAWQDVPERALIPANGYAGQRIIRDARHVLKKLDLTVLERAA